MQSTRVNLTFAERESNIKPLFIERVIIETGIRQATVPLSREVIPNEFEVHTHTLPGSGPGTPADAFSQEFHKAYTDKAPDSNKIVFQNHLYSLIGHRQDNGPDHDGVPGQIADNYVLYQRR